MRAVEAPSIVPVVTGVGDWLARAEDGGSWSLPMRATGVEEVRGWSLLVRVVGLKMEEWRLLELSHLIRYRIGNVCILYSMHLYMYE